MIFKILTSINLSKDCIGSPKSTEQLQIDMHIFANLGKRFGYRNLIIWSPQTLITPVWLQPKVGTAWLSELLVCLGFGGQILRQKSYSRLEPTDQSRPSHLCWDQRKISRFLLSSTPMLARLEGTAVFSRDGWVCPYPELQIHPSIHHHFKSLQK